MTARRAVIGVIESTPWPVSAALVRVRRSRVVPERVRTPQTRPDGAIRLATVSTWSGILCGLLPSGIPFSTYKKSLAAAGRVCIRTIHLDSVPVGTVGRAVRSMIRSSGNHWVYPKPRHVERSRDSSRRGGLDACGPSACVPLLCTRSPFQGFGPVTHERASS